MHSIFLHSFHLKKITQHVLLTFSSSCNLHSSDVTQGYEEQRMNVRLAFEEIFGTAVTDSNTSSMTITALQNFFCPQVRLLFWVSTKTTILENFKKILLSMETKSFDSER